MGYQLFDGEDREYEVARPVGRRVKDLFRLELRAPFDSEEEKINVCELFGFDPLDTIPEYTGTVTVQEDGEEVEKEIECEAEPIYLDTYFAEVAEVIFLGVDAKGREDDLDEGRVMEGKVDFLREWGGTSVLRNAF